MSPQRVPSILIVEDQAIIAMSQAAILEAAGFRVATALSAEAAIGRVEAGEEIDLIFMDIDLGRGMDGTEAANRILELREVPIVFLTSHAEREMVEKVKGITRYGYVLKNTGQFVLVESANMALELFGAHRGIERLNRLYRVLSGVNQLIVRERDPERLYEALCAFAITEGGLSAAWVGLPDRSGSRIEPVAVAGATDALETELRIDVTSENPVVRAYRTGKRQVEHRIAETDGASWRNVVARADMRSLVSLPVLVAGTARGVITFYASEADYFDDREIALLDELALDLGFALEVHEQEQRRMLAEDERRHTEELMRYVVRHDPNAIAIFDRSMRYLFVSDRYLDDYHLTSRDIVGRSHYEVFPEIPARWREVHRRALAGETIAADDDYFVRDDGTVDYLHWECRPWTDSDGRVGGMILYSEVITERKMAERERHTVLGTLQSLLANSPDLLAFVTPRGAIRMVSASAASLVGMAPCCSEDAPLEALFPASMLPSVRESIARVVSSREPVSVTDTVGGRDVAMTLHSTYYPAQIADGEVAIVGIVSVRTDERCGASRQERADEFGRH